MRKSELTRRRFLAGSVLSAAAVAFSTASAAARVVGSNDRISIGLIGAGSRGMALKDDLVGLSKDLNAEITAVCDTWRVQREFAASEVNRHFGGACRSFSDYEQLLALDDVDAVIIATPDFAHAKMLTDSVRADKDVYIEKPMAIDLEEARTATDAAVVAKRVVQVGTQRRSEGKWRAVAKAIGSGVLGTISRVEVAWNDNSPRWRRDYSDLKKEDVDWNRYLMGRPDRPFDPKQYRRWHLYREFSIGVIGCLGSHYLDLAAWLMDDPYPSSAVAHGGNYVWTDDREHEDTVYALYDYPKGFICRYLTGLGNSAESGCRVYGTNGTFTEAGFRITGEGGAGAGAVKADTPIKAEPGESHMGNWVRCIRSREQTNAPIEVGYQDSVACIMGYRALVSGRRMGYLPVTRRIVEKA